METLCVVRQMVRRLTDRSSGRKPNMAENTHVRSSSLQRMVCGQPRVWLCGKVFPFVKDYLLVNMPYVARFHTNKQRHYGWPTWKKSITEYVIYILIEIEEFIDKVTQIPNKIRSFITL